MALESIFLKTGCVPDYAYAALLVLIGVGGLILRRRLRSAGTK